MKSHLVVVAVACAALLCGFAFQNPPAQDPVGRIEKLEKDLAASRLRVEAMSTEVAEMKKLVAATVQYLEAQSKAAGAMAIVLDESEKAGFTYGLNPDSRHLLLRGWREVLATARKDVPAAEPPPEKPAPARAPARPAPKPPEKAGA